MTYEQFYEGQRVAFFSDHEDRYVYGTVIEVAKNPQRVFVLWDGDEDPTSYAFYSLGNIVDADEVCNRQIFYLQGN